MANAGPEASEVTEGANDSSTYDDASTAWRGESVGAGAKFGGAGGGRESGDCVNHASSPPAARRELEMELQQVFAEEKESLSHEPERVAES